MVHPDSVRKKQKLTLPQFPQHQLGHDLCSLQGLWYGLLLLLDLPTDSEGPLKKGWPARSTRFQCPCLLLPLGHLKLPLLKERATKVVLTPVEFPVHMWLQC